MYVLKKSIWLPISKEAAWEFFQAPQNLNRITPSDMNFEILDTSDAKQMFPGQIIQYRIQLFPLVKVKWVTEITHVENHSFFVDEQRFGPYAFWHHKHFLIPENGGVRVKDIVHYKLPFGFLGTFVHKIYVRKKLESIFAFREQTLHKIFS